MPTKNRPEPNDAWHSSRVFFTFGYIVQELLDEAKLKQQ
jgi:hypothetical protein